MKDSFTLSAAATAGASWTALHPGRHPSYAHQTIQHNLPTLRLDGHFAGPRCLVGKCTDPEFGPRCILWHQIYYIKSGRPPFDKPEAALLLLNQSEHNGLRGQRPHNPDCPMVWLGHDTRRGNCTLCSTVSNTFIRLHRPGCLQKYPNRSFVDYIDCGCPREKVETVEGVNRLPVTAARPIRSPVVLTMYDDADGEGDDDDRIMDAVDHGGGDVSDGDDKATDDYPEGDGSSAEHAVFDEDNHKRDDGDYDSWNELDSTHLSRDEAKASFFERRGKTELDLKFEAPSSVVEKLMVEFSEAHASMLRLFPARREDVVLVASELRRAIHSVIARGSCRLFEDLLGSLSNADEFTASEAPPLVLRLSKHNDTTARWLADVVEKLVCHEVLKALNADVHVDNAVVYTNPKNQVLKFIPLHILDSFGYGADNDDEYPPNRLRPSLRRRPVDPEEVMGRDYFSRSQLEPATAFCLIWPALDAGLWCSRLPVVIPPKTLLRALIRYTPSSEGVQAVRGAQSASTRLKADSYLAALKHIATTLNEEVNAKLTGDKLEKAWFNGAATGLRKQFEAAFFALSTVSARYGVSPYLEPGKVGVHDIIPHISKAQLRGPMLVAHQRYAWAHTHFAMNWIIASLEHASRIFAAEYDPVGSYARSATSKVPGLLVIDDAVEFFRSRWLPAIYELSYALGDAWCFADAATVFQFFATNNWACAALQVLFQYFDKIRCYRGFLPFDFKEIQKALKMDGCCRSFGPNGTCCKKRNPRGDCGRHSPCCWSRNDQPMSEHVRRVRQHLRRILCYDLLDVKSNAKPDDTSLGWLLGASPSQCQSHKKALLKDAYFMFRVCSIIGRLPPFSTDKTHLGIVDQLMQTNSSTALRFLRQLIKATKDVKSAGEEFNALTFKDADDATVIGLLCKNKDPDTVSLVLNRFYEKVLHDASAIVGSLDPLDSTNSTELDQFIAFYRPLNETFGIHPNREHRPLAMVAFMMGPLKELIFQLGTKLPPPPFVASEFLQLLTRLLTTRWAAPFSDRYSFFDRPPW
jgi:hypothetical protein